MTQVKLALFALNHRLKKPFDRQVLYQTGLEIALDVETMIGCLGFAVDVEAVKKMYEELPIYTKNEMKINGNDLQTVLNQKPGKWLGELMTEIESAILKNEVSNESQELLKWVTNRYKLED